MIFFLMVRTLKMNSQQILSIQYGIITSCHHAVHSISRTYSFCVTDLLYRLTNRCMHFSSPPTTLPKLPRLLIHCYSSPISPQSLSKCFVEFKKNCHSPNIQINLFQPFKIFNICPDTL